MLNQMSHNELVLTTLSVAEPSGVSVGAVLANARNRDGGQCGFSPSKGERSESRSEALMRCYAK